MTKDQLLVKLLRYHGIQSVMVESNYITVSEFYSNLIELQDQLGVLDLDEKGYEHLIHPFVD